MYDRPREPHDFLDDLPEQMKERVLLLRGLRLLSKELPNLPDGKLRIAISEDITHLLNSGSASRLTITQLIKKCDELTDTNLRLERAQRSDPYDEGTSRQKGSSFKLWFVIGIIVIAILAYQYKMTPIPGEPSIPKGAVDPALKN